MVRLKMPQGSSARPRTEEDDQGGRWDYLGASLCAWVGLGAVVYRTNGLLLNSLYGPPYSPRCGLWAWASTGGHGNGHFVSRPSRQSHWRLPTRSRASWAQTTRRQRRSSTAGFYSPYRTRGERKSGDLPRLPVGVGAFGSPFAKHTRGNKRRRGAGEGFCDPTHRDPGPAWRRLRGKSGFFKTAATAGGCFKSCTKCNGIVIDTLEYNSVTLGAPFDALPPLRPPPRAGFWEASPAAPPPLVTAAGLYRFL